MPRDISRPAADVGRCVLLTFIAVVTGSCNPERSPTAPQARPETGPALAAVAAATTAVVGGPYSGVEGTPIAFDGSRSTGTGLKYTWDFGDGTPRDSTSGPTPTHTYADNKKFTVRLFVTDASGVKSSTSQTTATVSNVPPVVADLVAPTAAPRAGTSASLSTTFTDAGTGDTHTGNFNWGDGRSTSATIRETSGSGTASASHTWSAAGTYTVTLRVVDDNGGADTVRLSLVVAPKNTAPTASAGGPYTAVEGGTVSFDGSASKDAENDPITYDWDFGDGTAHGTTVNPTHVYADNGAFIVTLIVTDSYGAKSTAAQATATIANVAPVVSGFTGPASNPIVGALVAVQGSFTDAGIRDTHSASLDWGDGSSSAGTVAETNGSGTVGASHVFATAGQYTVRLRVTDNAGASDSAKLTITVDAPPPGTLVVTTSTAGSDLDPDGYTVTVDGNPSNAQSIGVNESVTFGGLSPGAHTVALSGVAANCSVDAPSQSFTITSGATTTVGFAVSCSPIVTTGTLAVNTSTTGSDLDPDGYLLSVDGGAGQPIAANGTLTIPNLTAGSHTVTLSGVAANCSVTANPQTTTIAAGSTTILGFAVTCSAVVTTGTVTVSTATSGSDLDPDGYLVSVDGGAGQPIAVNGSSSFPDLAAGEHTVALSGVASNCSADASSKTVTVTAGGTTAVSFTVTCSAIITTGALVVSASTTGSDLDPDGYLVTLDGNAAAAQPIGVNGSLTFSALASGSHTVELSGFAPNCSVDASSKTAIIMAGQTASLSFTLTCAPIVTTGTLLVSTTTTGSDLDPDGYVVSIDGGQGQPIGVNASLSVPNLSAGQHTVALSGVAANCSVDASSKTAAITAGSTTPLSFSVSCSQIVTTGTLVVATSTTGSDLDPDGYLVSVDGGPGQPIGVNGTLNVPNLTAGSHTVSLSGVASNCTVSANPQSVTIAAAGTTSLSFAVSCAAIGGSITVAVSTVGRDFDPDGYAAIVDSGTTQAVALTVAPNGSSTFAGVAPGSHTVSLAGLASNCSLGITRRTVSVSSGATTQLGFAVFCMALHASAYTFVGAGDIADCTRVDDEATAGVLNGLAANDPGTIVYTLGDNVYQSATATELASCYAPSWGAQQVRTFATLGNHEYAIDPNPTWDYFGTRAGPRGLGYYSYNIGDYWHVIVLSDNASYGGPARTAGSAQDLWLQADLAANTKPCIIAMWHQPLVSSDGWYSASRKIFWDRLYAARADIVLNGHLHYYERMYPQTPDLVRDDANGIRQFIVGTGGASTYTPDTLTVNTVTVAPSRGVLKLTLGPGTYSWEFVWAKGQTYTDSGSGTCH